ncbi:PQQ-dependent sugar dehydrogenase [Tautonia plasticadhaerens]|uniref:Soluble aldose sugar dehydrogenase YliI n=1 Tax=Tautonia plasticadhaerens TaxID=2527974 RepID=A0A518H0L5_9BACT|nr:PQQ-dependent sugar dehydrogenase [Tautonia plasticadhaerens]QDV34351.1 Soluble aldose sugar dehydrogenase YliI precursor [Tautonia plasticadhaerens]
MSRLLRSLGLLPVFVSVAMLVPGWFGPPDPPADPTASPDPEASGRVPWTSSRVVGSPEPPRPYTVEVAFPKLTFDRPLELAFVPGTDRLAVAQSGGRVVTFANDPGADRADLLLDLKAVEPKFAALYGLAFHPDFGRNGRFYACYTVGYAIDDGTRVSEFRVDPDRRDPPRADPASERILITWYAGGHNGGSLKFGPKDGYLYISAGDGADPTPPDPFLAGQDLGTLMSKVMRIDVDAQDPGRAYRVPPDNPFVGLEGARPEVWAYGFRNPWRMGFDRESGDLWLGDVGWELWELVHRVEEGGNYGWSLMEGSQPVMPDGPRGPTPISPPIVQHPHSEAASMTGGFVYRGDRFEDLKGAYVYGDYQTGTVWGLRYDGEAVTRHEVLAETPLRLVAFGEDRAGELFLLDYEQSNTVYRLVPNPDASKSNRRFPRTLGETGLFASVEDLVPSPGVLPYRINAPFWDDGTEGDRLMALPGTSRIGFEREKLWKFPEGSVLARTVTIDLGASGTRRLETQILHFEDGSWRPYSYRWDDEQAEATLSPPEGETVAFSVADPEVPGGERTVTHRISARSECVLCHNPWAGEGLLFGRQSATPLTANTLQMNVQELDDDEPIDQLRSFERLGLFDGPLPESPEALPRLSNPYDESADLASRARSYLQVNCAHCHRFGAGGSAAMFLTADRPMPETGTLGVRPMQGAFDLDDARIIDPGDPFGSVLYFRMAKLGAGRMPRVGPKRVDDRGVDLMYRWIASLKDDGTTGPPADPFGHLPAEVSGAIARLRGEEPMPVGACAEAFEQATGTVRGALALVRRVDEGSIAGPVAERLVALSREHPRAEVRDLFERFVPESERVERLGDAIEFDALLALAGDADRGRVVFFGNSSQCQNCHRVGGEGRVVGPDLDGIGAKYPKRELLDHIVSPSKQVDPQYVSYILETTTGLIHSGVLVQANDDFAELKDAEGLSIRVEAGEIEQLVPRAESLMPERLLGSLTAQEAADLLEYLSTLREVASP